MWTREEEEEEEEEEEKEEEEEEDNKRFKTSKLQTSNDQSVFRDICFTFSKHIAAFCLSPEWKYDEPRVHNRLVLFPRH